MVFIEIGIAALVVGFVVFDCWVLSGYVKGMRRD